MAFATTMWMSLFSALFAAAAVYAAIDGNLLHGAKIIIVNFMRPLIVIIIIM